MTKMRWITCLIGVAAIFTPGCGPAQDKAAAQAGGVKGVKMIGPYSGEITGLPKAEDKIPRILIEHQPIAGLGPVAGNYAKSDDERGRVSMPFWTDVSSASFHEKESVQFCLRVNWDHDRPVVITALEPLTDASHLTLTCH